MGCRILLSKSRLQVINVIVIEEGTYTIFYTWKTGTTFAVLSTEEKTTVMRLTKFANCFKISFFRGNKIL